MYFRIYIRYFVWISHQLGPVITITVLFIIPTLASPPLYQSNAHTICIFPSLLVMLDSKLPFATLWIVIIRIATFAGCNFHRKFASQHIVSLSQTDTQNTRTAPHHRRNRTQINHSPVSVCMSHRNATHHVLCKHVRISPVAICNVHTVHIHNYICMCLLCNQMHSWCKQNIQTLCARLILYQRTELKRHVQYSILLWSIILYNT